MISADKPDAHAHAPPVADDPPHEADRPGDSRSFEARHVWGPDRRFRAADWAVLILTAAVLVGFRLHAFELPLETDECNYAYIAGRLLAGDRLYTDVWDHQPPGVFVLFAAVIRIAGDTDAVIRWFAAGCSVLTLVLVFAVAGRRIGRPAAWLVAALFAVTSSDPGTAGDGCNREIYMNACLVGAMALLLWSRKPGGIQIGAAGLVIGLASVLKPVVAVHWVLLLGWVMVVGGSMRRRRLFRPVLLFAAGPALLWSSIAAYFAATGRFGAFVDAVFRFNVVYADDRQVFWARFGRFFRPYIGVFASSAPLWIALVVAAAGLLLILLATARARRRRKAVRWASAGTGTAAGAVLIYLLASYLAVCLPAQFWPHYYYLMIPAAILTVAAAASYLFHARRRWIRSAAWVVAPVLLVAQIRAEYVHYLGVAPRHVTAPRYDYRMQWARVQGQHVAAVTDPDDTIFVYGHDVGIYRYAHRRCASRFTMVRALAPRYAGYETRRRQLLDDLKRNRPRLVLLVENEFEQLARFLQENYRLVGLDRDDENPDKPIMLVLADKDRPVPNLDWEYKAPRQPD